VLKEFIAHVEHAKACCGILVSALLHFCRQRSQRFLPTARNEEEVGVVGVLIHELSRVLGCCERDVPQCDPGWQVLVEEDALVGTRSLLINGDDEASVMMYQRGIEFLRLFVMLVM